MSHASCCMTHAAHAAFRMPYATFSCLRQGLSLCPNPTTKTFKQSIWKLFVIIIMYYALFVYKCKCCQRKKTKPTSSKQQAANSKQKSNKQLRASTTLCNVLQLFECSTRLAISTASLQLQHKQHIKFVATGCATYTYAFSKYKSVYWFWGMSLCCPNLCKRNSKLF